MELKVDIKVLPGQRCIVNNYRTRPNDWEVGTVMDVTARISHTGFIYPRYHVILDRVSKSKSKNYPNGGRPLTLTVSSDRIDRCNCTDKTCSCCNEV